MESSASHIALLAPVPLEHLLDGAEVAQQQGKVAFGSRAFELFRKLDEIREGLAVDVYIYASHTNRMPKLEVSWQGRYVGTVENPRADDLQFRPPSTLGEEGLGYWALHWHVEELRELLSPERIPTADLTGWDKKKPYGRGFAPEGPLLIEHP